MSEKHYENFPVASLLLPRKFRRPVAVIYDFARQADDFADEGGISDAERLFRLGHFRSQLHLIENGRKPDEPLFESLAEIIAEHALPLRPFFDLLDAFSQDVTKKRYADFGELLSYCERSANPVGKILLHLYNQATAENIVYSDKICSSLQIINFLQDIDIDFKMGRIYIPLNELGDIPESEITQRNENWENMMLFQIERARKMMLEGSPLGSKLSGRIGFEMRMIIQGGLRILELLENDLSKRPKLSGYDWAVMFFRALF